MTTYTLNVVFDLNEESQQSVWNIVNAQGNVVTQNVGQQLNGLFSFYGGDTLQVQVFATSNISDLTLNECYLICKPKLAHAGSLSGVVAGTYPLNSPFGDYGVISCLPGNTAVPMNTTTTRPTGITIPTTVSTYSYIVNNEIAPLTSLTITNAGRWEISLLISVSSKSQGISRVFTMDPEFQVSQGTLPPG